MTMRSWTGDWKLGWDQRGKRPGGWRGWGDWRRHRWREGLLVVEGRGELVAPPRAYGVRP